MAFRFNFSNPDGENEEITQNQNSILAEKNEDYIAPFSAVVPSSISTKYENDIGIVTYNISHSLEVQCYNSADLEKKFADSSTSNSAIAKAVTSNSDLIPSEYEGGLTVWECGIDLAKFIGNGNVNVKGKKVLELGCGAGLPGICAMKLGAKEVHFQDYNVGVIQAYTIPNVEGLNNTGDCKTAFFSGDWSEMCRMAKGNEDLQYDITLTAETIYTPSSYEKLHNCFSTMLRSDGTVYVAAKSNYFGVGGGTRSFEEYVNKMDKFSIEVVEEIGDGVPREILKLSWK